MQTARKLYAAWEAGHEFDKDQIEALRATSSTVRSRVRGFLLVEGIPKQIVYEMFPKTTVGAKQKMTGAFKLSRPVKMVVAKSLDLEAMPEISDDWTIEKASTAADAIVAYSTNPSSIAGNLAALRGGLKSLNCLDEVISATLRPEVTIAMNTQCEERRAIRATRGLNVPPPFERISDLTTRVQGYLTQENWVPDGQAAADYLVALSARPGENRTLKLTTDGRISGALKKRGNMGANNLVSALGESTAQDLMKLWEDAKQADRAKSMTHLKQLTKKWGIARRDLRAIGSTLAVRAAVLNGTVKNVVEARDVQQAALRHGTPRREAVDNYARVNDDSQVMAATIAELDEEKMGKMKDLLESFKISMRIADLKRLPIINRAVADLCEATPICEELLCHETLEDSDVDEGVDVKAHVEKLL